jgi:putative ABC transport system permease protein
MLVSVTERTKEIGIRKAIGATNRDITVQFLIESMVLTACGGLAGILVGAGVSWAVSKYAQWPVSLTTIQISLAILSSGLIGIVFGILPARKAASLNPINALRYE